LRPKAALCLCGFPPYIASVSGRRILVLFGKSLLAALAVAFAGLVTLGLPGAMLLAIAAPLTGDPDALARLGDGAWPAAIVTAALAPLAIVPVNVTLALCRPQWPRWQHLAWVAGLALLAGIAVAAIVLRLARG
jgi:hypothetical protein